MLKKNKFNNKIDPNNIIKVNLVIKELADIDKVSEGLRTLLNTMFIFRSMFIITGTVVKEKYELLKYIDGVKSVDIANAVVSTSL